MSTFLCGKLLIYDSFNYFLFSNSTFNSCKLSLLIFDCFCLYSLSTKFVDLQKQTVKVARTNNSMIPLPPPQLIFLMP